MKIWIMRHGEASFDAPNDSQRNLTQSGQAVSKAQGSELAERFKQENIRLDKIIVSPYLRAKQTANAVNEGIQAVDFQQNFAKIQEEWEGITPDANVDTVVDYLAFLKEEGAKNVMLISHLPLVFELVQALTHNQAPVHFFPAVIAEINWENEVGNLTRTINP